jgi:hypothetical protein
MRQIIVTLPLKGPVQIETKGFTGNACLKATASLKAKLGDVVSETPNEEMFLSEQQAQEQGNG